MNNLKLQKENICAIIVTYNPDVKFSERAASIASQVSHVLIVDNGSDDISKEYLKQLGNLSNFRIIYNQDNLGIGAALNIGIKYALKSGYDWVATFDQDSKPTQKMIASMIKAYETLPNKENLALISPRFQSQSIDLLRTFVVNSKQGKNKSYAPILTTMTSGSLIRTKIFSLVGYFNEAMFIDFVDQEFCLRCAKCGFVIIEAQKAILIHDLGQPIQHKFLWKKCTVTNHNYLRRYYDARNRIYVYKKYFVMYPKWILSNLCAFPLDLLKILFFENDRMKKIYSVILGIYHGLIGKMGKR